MALLRIFQKGKEQQKTAKTTEVVGFGDKFFTLSIDRYFLKEGGIVKSLKKCPGQT